MAFSFDKLPREAKRAAFAAMDRTRGAGGKKAGGSPTSKTSSSAAAGSGTAAKRINAAKKASGGKTGDLNRTVPTDTGGRISLRDAAVLMFGTAGAAARIAKHNARRKRPRK